jgi:hypothetical protein
MTWRRKARNSCSADPRQEAEGLGMAIHEHPLLGTVITWEWDEPDRRETL